MDKELQQYYEERFSLMTTKGWNDLIEDVDKLKLSVADITTVKNGDDLQFRKGQLDIINWILTLKQVSESAYQGLKDEGIV